MSVLSWNFRGLGNPGTVQFLKDIVYHKKPMIVFLCETLCSKDLIEDMARHIHFEGCFVVDAVGRGGGLALLWKSVDDVGA